MSRELRTVTRARHRLTDARTAFTVAMVEAREKGHTLQEIGDAAGGISRNAVRQALARLYGNQTEEEKA